MPVLVIVPVTIAALSFLTAGEERTSVAALPDTGIFVAPMNCDDPLACVVQNHVDVDPSPKAVDNAGGARTYDGHQGVDFRILDLPTMLEGVPVVAIADGEVTGVRDGEYDGAWLAQGREAVGNRDCGNGVSITHADGYTSQICHLRRDSVTVKTGDTVTQGQQIGTVGMSGRAEFPHVHVSISKDGKRIDPFTSCAIGEACDTNIALWDGGVREHWGAKAGPFIFKSGFTSEPVTLAMIERKPADPTRNSNALVFYARAVGLKAGDVEKIELIGPEGFQPLSSIGEPLDRAKAQTMRFVGRPAKDKPLPAGEYQGRYSVERNGEPVLDISRSFYIE